jgi:hypothetical protein
MCCHGRLLDYLTLATTMLTFVASPDSSSNMADNTNGGFDFSDVKSALGEVTLPGRDVKYEGKPADADEVKERARTHGFGARVDYNYTEKESSRKVSKFTRCDWTATGDLGVYAPRIPELEAELFPDDFTYGKGLCFDILENVKIEVTGEDPVEAIERVSYRD